MNLTRDAQLFVKSLKREPMLLTARKGGLVKLAIAIRNAVIFSKMQANTLVNTGTRGENIQVQVIDRLEQISVA